MNNSQQRAHTDKQQHTPSFKRWKNRNENNHTKGKQGKKGNHFGEYNFPKAAVAEQTNDERRLRLNAGNGEDTKYVEAKENWENIDMENENVVVGNI